ncbi:MAG: D-alanyl-D-alanine carboxypeptidase/D-alanyl-D-alanine-endopeptidase, partial [Limisphaerales bacterium]
NPSFRHATWGVAVHDADSGISLFETNSHRLLKPASNAKLFTGALALQVLGPNSRLATRLIPTGPVSPTGVLDGDLIVQGGGDFSFSPRFHSGNPTASLARIVDTLRDTGLRQIEGDLVADDSVFVGPPFGNGWTWDDLRYYYGAEVSALSVDDNILAFECAPGAAPGTPPSFSAGPGASYFEFQTRGLATVEASQPRSVVVRRDPGSRVVHLSGSLPAGAAPSKHEVTVPEPALFFVHRLREELAAVGIKVKGTVRHDRQTLSSNAGPSSDPAHTTLRRRSSRKRAPALPVAPPISVLSPPVSSLVGAMMKPSQNLYAQLLLLQVGARSSASSSLPSSNPPSPDLTTEDAGVAALRRFVREAGIPVDEVQLDDGSGLSRSSLVTPAATVALLRFMDRHPAREAFLDALPIAGRDGTLRRRFVGTPLEGNLRAKTGSLRHVHALSGFLTNTAGKRLVFSALLNAYAPPESTPPPSPPSGRDALDTLVLRLAQSPPPDPP